MQTRTASSVVWHRGACSARVKKVSLALGSRFGSRCPKMTEDGSKVAPRWPQVGQIWVFRRSWKWPLVDDVVQK